MKYGKFPQVGEIWRHVPWSDGVYQKNGWIKVVAFNLKGHKKYDGGKSGIVLVRGSENRWEKQQWFYPCASYQYFIDDMHAKFLEREDVVKKKSNFEWKENDFIHQWFELSYAQYLTIPRSVLQSMPSTWQKEFVRLLEELDETYDWRPKRGRYRVQLLEQVENLSDGGRLEWGQEIEDPLMDYQRGGRILTKEIPLKKLKTCSSCFGMKRHHSDRSGCLVAWKKPPS